MVTLQLPTTKNLPISSKTTTSEVFAELFGFPLVLPDSCKLFPMDRFFQVDLVR